MREGPPFRQKRLDCNYKGKSTDCYNQFWLIWNISQGYLNRAQTPRLPNRIAGNLRDTAYHLSMMFILRTEDLERRLREISAL